MGMVKVLIVDDDLQIIRTIGNAFTTLIRGYQLFTATTANQGLNYIKQEKPDVIIMDVRLGPASGMDLLEDYPKHIKDYRPHIIVITAYRDEKAEKRAQELKVDAFLYKPFRSEALLIETVKSVIKYHESEISEAKFILKALEGKLGKSEQTNQELDEKLKEESSPEEKDNPPEDPPENPPKAA